MKINLGTANELEEMIINTQPVISQISQKDYEISEENHIALIYIVETLKRHGMAYSVSNLIDLAVDHFVQVLVEEGIEAFLYRHGKLNL